MRWRSASWLSIDCFWLARSATIWACCSRAVFRRSPPLLDLLAELHHVSEHLRVLIADALHHVEAAEEVVEVLRSEEDLDGAAAVTVHVQRPQAIGDVRLGRVEALLRDDEMVRVRVQVGVDLIELDVRVVVRLDRLLELDVGLLDLGQHRLCLGPFRLDRVRGSRADAGQKSHYAQQGQ